MHTRCLPPYAHSVFFDKSSQEYVAECLEIPSLSGLGETEAEAVAALHDAISGWLEVLEEDGFPFPPPFFDMAGDLFFEGTRRGSTTMATGKVSSLEESYPEIQMEQDFQKGTPPTEATSLS